MTRIAAIGPLSIDSVGGGVPRPGGTAFYAGLTFGRLDADAHVAISCSAEHRSALDGLHVPARWYESAETTAFSFRYTDSGRRIMSVDAVGDAWSPDDALEAAGDATWVYIGALLRSHFPSQTLDALVEASRKLLLDAQGFVRRPALGPLQLDGAVGDVVERASILKLDDQEAEALVGAADPAALRRLAVPEIVLTLGARGSMIVTSRAVQSVPAIEMTGAIDPTGAGDTLAAAYLVARADGAEPLEALRDATETVGEFLSGK